METALSDRSKQIRREAIKIAKANGGYHWGGTFSCIEISLILPIFQPFYLVVLMLFFLFSFKE